MPPGLNLAATYRISDAERRATVARVRQGSAPGSGRFSRSAKPGYAGLSCFDAEEKT